ncbi:kelch repeat-containing protein [Flavobacterium wongokense]|uniref:kelch repeat-containing protein n=1 Tax=Flavobacterium wongokense TaxID=2910674 RepID=UPI001F21BD53|nr:kelch repeat-containing protein [Flavobacterium sp. WG47]MCF6130886.1 T9SS type A sorting domain-containing protein [Flavobacterium sp. WG47]
MKKILLFLLLAGLTATAQPWVAVAPMALGSERYNAVSFAIGNKGYVCTGQTTTATRETTFEYNPDANTWTQKSNFPAGKRRGSRGFTVGNKAYVLTGRDDTLPNGNIHNDMWEFDPATDTWTQKANYPGGNREDLIAFGIGNYGYAGFGLAGSRKLDFYKYDPSTDTWTRLADINYYWHHYESAVFVLNGKGYFATGSAYNGTTFNDYTSDHVFMFDPATETWTQKNNFTGGARRYTTAFTVNGKAYMGLGYTGQFPIDLWQYNEAADSWTQVGDFTGGNRFWTSTFTLGSKVYVGNGRNSNSLTLTTFYSWEPTLALPEYNADPFTVVSAQGSIVISSAQPAGYSAAVYALDGKAVLSDEFPNDATEHTISHALPHGIYLLHIANEGKRYSRKIVVP